MESATWSPCPGAPSVFYVLTANIHERLLKVDENYELKPNLAERFETSPDGETWTFHLRQGVKWNDGQPFTSADVKYNLDWLRNPDNGLRRLLGRATLDRFVAGRTSCQN